MRISHAAAHHEAIFGGQSALGLSGETYASAQVFTRRVGPNGQGTQETTTVLSGGLSPWRRPVSISFVAPFSVIRGGSDDGTRVGLENAIVAARYRIDLGSRVGLLERFRVGTGVIVRFTK